MKFILTALLALSAGAAFAMDCPLQALRKKVGLAEKNISIAKSRLEYLKRKAANMTDVESEVLESGIYLERAREQLRSADSIKGACKHHDIAAFEMMGLDSMIPSMQEELVEIENETYSFIGEVITVTAPKEEVKKKRARRLEVRWFKERSNLEYR